MAERIDIEGALPPLKMLLYGYAGSGKTRLAGTAALDERTSPVLWLDSGGNPISLRKYPQKPDIIEVEAYADFNPFYNWLAEGQPKNDPIVAEYQLKPTYKTLVIDTITDTQRLAFDMITGNSHIRPGQVPAQIEIQHFNRILSTMTKFAYYFLEKLDMNVIITAQEDLKNNFAEPLIWGAADREVSGYALMVMRLIHYTRMEGRIEQALSDEIPDDFTNLGLITMSQRFAAKDQYGTGQTHIFDPTITKVLDLIAQAGA